ncbi:unnamed protein product [Blepharisma stoltei]|uniref:GTP-binding protein n=1 Tax=Blepharisma stoltei TaxID=1481888 RepID=A0AAU9JPA2_9CILI|nr:unnamed protein product [Blepharisma stoltei]
MSQNLIKPGFDVLVFGDENVGKSAILNKYCAGDFEINSEIQRLESKNCNERHKIIQANHENMQVSLWEYQNWAMHGMLPLFFGKPYAIIFCYDVTNRKSFKNISNWISKFDERLIKNFTGILVGNKSDLPRERGVSYNEGKKLAEKLGLLFMETSAEYSKNIDEIFNILLRILALNFDR